MKAIMALVVLALAWSAPVSATPIQDTPAGVVTVRVRAVSEDGPVDAATARAGAVVAITNEDGEATLGLPIGVAELTVTKLGFADAVVEITVAAGGENLIEVTMEEGAEELDAIVVTSTRTERRIEDVPVRVEVLAEEEVQEKLMMTPGDVAMMLNETSGLRVQNTSPSLGGASLRVQGLRGRYTQVLSDGLPLYGGQTGSLSMLQIPPMDLAQVEVIKGAASALYGSSALGGVVNLITRVPADEREILLNQTTLGGTDGVVWLADEVNEGWGYTFLGSLHRQSQADVDDDGWADLPGYRRAVVRPRVRWADGAGRSLFVTAGATIEDREGGTKPGSLTPGGTSFPERLDTRRGDVGLVGRFLTGGERLVTLRASAMTQRHDHLFGDAGEEDAHSNAFLEAALSGSGRGHLWVIGGAVTHERYSSEAVPAFDFGHTIPSVFAQDEFSPWIWMTLSLSARIDRHSEEGAFASPRLSALFRQAGWTVRASLGTGYFPPTPFTEETEAVGLGRLEPITDLEAETALSGSLDVGRVFGTVEVNATLFGSEIDDALQAQDTDAGLRLVNAGGPTRTWGGEALARWRFEPFQVTATYTRLRSRESDPNGSGRREVPLTARDAFGVVGMWEEEGVGRLGLELYYTGEQELEDNPYRSTSRPYFVTGLLAERVFGRLRIFLNAENFLDARQTEYDPLTLPARSTEGRWTTDVWGPLEGRVVNAGIRYEF